MSEFSELEAKVEAAVQDVEELVQLRTRVDQDEKQLADLQVEVKTLAAEVSDLKAAHNKPA